MGAIPGFEFPRKNLYDYTINVIEINEEEALPDDFIVGTIWGELDSMDMSTTPKVLVDRSYFTAELTEEEINILAILMK